MPLHRYAIGLVLLLIPIHAFSAIINVPDDHTTIQEAVDAASDGDTILIADGVYSGTGNIGIQWDASIKHLVIMSENGRDHCIIDCMEEGRGFTLTNGQDHRDVIDGLTITNGNGVNAGGAVLIDATSPRIINCTLVNNTAFGDMDFYYGGGAIMVSGNANPVIQGNIIRGNYAGHGGGGISFSKGAAGVVENNIIDSNETHGEGGGIAHYYNSNPLIINNLIINNFSRGHIGGGIFTSISNPSIINNTIAYNTTYIEYYPGLGGGIGIDGEPYPVIRNCIIWYNIASHHAMNIQFPLKSWLDISYCNVENDLGHIFDLKPHTNIDSLPAFVDPENGDFSLSWNSPCINKGTPDTTGLYLPSSDLAGNDRIYEDIVDIGAYESQHSTSSPELLDGEGFRVYPNPGSGMYILECLQDKHEDLLVEIHGVNGERVYEIQPGGDTEIIPIDLSMLPGGIYFVTVYSKGQVLFRQKVIKV
ncbi:MAG: right-handed parallel beta-helix repeat-containing protein [Bacteroidota bacterium]|nr:right-handed parallel beta-helix repeat-containing protein [Bacteroidota bacterium]